MLAQQYFLEGILVLSCYIGAFSRFRYPGINEDWKVYKEIVLNYSGMRDMYEKIDLLFFYQWPRSIQSSKSEYKKLRNHPELVNVLSKVFGAEQSISPKSSPNRFLSVPKLLTVISPRSIPGFDQRNFETYIELFSNCEILYRFVRCQAVHHRDFPLFNEISEVESGKVRYESNHIIDELVIHKTVDNIAKNLGTECLKENKWPWELP